MVSFIIPFYNEEDVLEKTPKEIYDFIKKHTKSFEIIFVSDGSTDKSPDLHIVTGKHEI